MNNNNTTYHPLGDYIRKIDKRNRDLALTKPMGINIDKQFMPSVANVIGTDMSNYKLVGKNQFACNLMHVGRDGKIPVAINTTEKEILVSPAYHVFEIVDKNALSPDFLMMWFHREEFDREASFYTDADVRSGMDFKALMEMRIPVPPISEQRAIVADYEAVARRIAVAKRTIATLQATAQTLYRKMFVDGIDKENLPEGWRWGTLGEVCEVKAGGDAPAIVIEERTSDCPYPIYANGFEKDGLYGFTNAPKITKPSFTISARGTIGYCCIRKEPYVPIVRLIVVIPNDAKMLNYFAIHFQTTKIEGDGSVQGQLTVPNVEAYKIAIPPMLLLQSFNKQYDVVSKGVELHSKEIEKLTEIQTIILSGMGR